jgi:hypothetical protein
MVSLPIAGEEKVNIEDDADTPSNRVGNGYHVQGS